MIIEYSSGGVRRCFEDISYMQRKVPNEWIRPLKKHINHLVAAETFGDFLDLALGRPEHLIGYKTTTYSVRITKNVRLILEFDEKEESVRYSTCVRVKGVVDYHGGKNNWFIP